MKVGASLRSGYMPPDVRTRRAVDDRAGPGRGRRRARQPVRRRPPQRAGALLPERPDAGPAARRVGRPARPARCSCCRCGIRCCSPNRSARSRRSRQGRSSCSARSAAATSSSARSGASIAATASRVRSRARHRAPAVRGRRGQTDGRARSTRADRADPTGAARGVDRRAPAPPAIDRAARLGDAFLIGPEATPARGRRPRRACTATRAARHGTDDGVDRRPPRHPRRRRRRRRGTRRGPGDRRAATAASIPTAPVVGRTETVAAAFAELGEMGCTDVIVRHLADDQAEVLKATNAGNVKRR